MSLPYALYSTLDTSALSLWYARIWLFVKRISENNEDFSKMFVFTEASPRPPTSSPAALRLPLNVSGRQFSNVFFEDFIPRTELVFDH